MPLKVKQLKSRLAKAGFVQRPAKGSHTFWAHPSLPGVVITLSGKDGADAEKYQLKQVRQALAALGETL